MNLPEWVANLDRYACRHCDTRPRMMGVRWRGREVEPYCLKCKSTMGPNEKTRLSPSKYGLERFRPPEKAEPGQGEMF